VVLRTWYRVATEFFPRPRRPAGRYCRMAAVSAKQLRQVARRVLQPERMAAVVVGSVTPGLSSRVERILRESFR